MEDFSHLVQLEDGKGKAKKAKQTVEALRKQIVGHKDIIEEEKKSVNCQLLEFFKPLFL